MAVEKVGALNFSISNIAKNSTTDFESVGVSQNGIDLRQALSSAPRFRGLSGDFSFVDGQIQSSAFEIVNVIGNVSKRIGFWTPKQGIVRELKFDAVNTTSRTNLKAITWPGETTHFPSGRNVPTNGKVLRVGVLERHFQSDFVRVERDLITNKPSFSGYCIDVFKAVMEALPYSVLYDFFPFDKGAYDALLRELSHGNFDAVVGDITIRENRSHAVDFTIPYTESGVMMIVPFKDNKNYNSAWVFLKPLTWDLWVTSACFFVFIGFLVWILERRINEDFNGNPLQQVSTSIWFSFSTMVFSHKEKVVSNLARFVVIIWCFVVLILTQSYTASLSSMLTVHRLEPSITDVQQLIKKGHPVGYPNASFVGDILKGMEFSESQLKGYHTVYGDLNAAFSNKSIVAAFDEIPYLKPFIGRHCSNYTMVPPTYKTGGFGFAFRKGSPLVRDVSTAILHVIEEGNMLKIEKKWLLSDSCPDSSNTMSSSNLSVNSFKGLFVIVGVAASFALIIFMAMLAYEHKSFLMHLDLKVLWRKYILKHEDTVTAMGIDTHQDQASPPSSPLSIAPSPPTQHSPTRSIVSDDTSETFTHFKGELAESHNPRHREIIIYITNENS